MSQFTSESAARVVPYTELMQHFTPAEVAAAYTHLNSTRGIIDHYKIQSKTAQGDERFELSKLDVSTFERRMRILAENRLVQSALIGYQIHSDETPFSEGLEESFTSLVERVDHNMLLDDMDLAVAGWDVKQPKRDKDGSETRVLIAKRDYGELMLPNSEIVTVRQRATYVSNDARPIDLRSVLDGENLRSHYDKRPVATLARASISMYAYHPER